MGCIEKKCINCRTPIFWIVGSETWGKEVLSTSDSYKQVLITVDCRYKLPNIPLNGLETKSITRKINSFIAGTCVCTIVLVCGVCDRHRFCFISQIAKFMGPTWGPSGADRTQVDPMLAPWTLLSGIGRVHKHRSKLFSESWHFSLYINYEIAPWALYISRWIITQCEIQNDKQRVLMHGHQGWNVRHGLCHICMIYVYVWVVYSFCLFCCLFIIVTTQFVALYKPCKPKPKPSTYDPPDNHPLAEIQRPILRPEPKQQICHQHANTDHFGE